MSVRRLATGFAAIAGLMGAGLVGAAADADDGAWVLRADQLGPKFGFAPEGSADFKGVAVYCLAPGLVKVVIEGFPATPGERATAALKAGAAEAAFTAPIERAALGDEGHVGETTALLDPRLKVFASRLPLTMTSASGERTMGESGPAEAWAQFQAACGGALVSTQGLDEIAATGEPGALMMSSLTTSEPPAGPSLHPALAVFGPMIGKTYRSDVKASEASAETQAAPDVQRWDIALGGHAVRTQHAIDDGSYAGESLIYPRSDGSLAYAYVTTAGFHTTGTMTIDDTGAWTAEEAVDGHETIAIVRSKGAIDADGVISTTSTYVKKDGTETPGHDFVYREVEARDLTWPALSAE